MHSPAPGEEQPRHPYTLVAQWVESIFADKDLGVPRGGHQSDHEATMHSKKGQQYGGVC